MTVQKKMTALASSVGADDKQSLNLIKGNLSEKPSCGNSDEEFLFFSEVQSCLKKFSDPNHLDTVTLEELYEAIYQPRTPTIEGLLYPGTYLFVGAPKIGKSFFMAQIGYHVSSGLPLWNKPVHKGTVLYLALEDDYARLQNRLYRMFGVEATDKFHFATDARRVKDGLDGQLKRFIQEHPDTRLMIIDTLQKVRELGGEKYSYASDYEIVSSLKQFADKHTICILIVHHTRKQEADDHFDTISGTNGLLGAADGALLIQKEKRTADKAILDIVGRDQQDQRLHLLFNKAHCIWELTEAETDVWTDPPDELLSAIASHVNENSPTWSGSASDLIDVLHIELQPNVLTRRLNVGAGRLFNEHHIRYENIRCHEGRRIQLTLEAEALP